MKKYLPKKDKLKRNGNPHRYKRVNKRKLKEFIAKNEEKRYPS